MDRTKFAVHGNSSNEEASPEVELMNILICFEDIEDLPVREMGDSGEADVPAVGEEEWNLVDKEDVSKR